MTSRDRASNWLLTYGGWLVLSVLVALWVLPVPQPVRIVVSFVCTGLCFGMHAGLRKGRRDVEGGD